MSLVGFSELLAEADARRPGVPVAAAGAEEVSVLEALYQAQARGWVRPILVGRQAVIETLAHTHNLSLQGMELYDTEEPARAAVHLLRQGQAELLLKGRIATPVLLKALLDPLQGLRTGQVICQIVLLENRRDGRRFLLADTGICIQPTLEQKWDILQSAVAVARALGCGRPRVALLAASEQVTPAMPETLEAAELVRRQQASPLPACEVQGPLSFDLAYAPEAGAKKGLSGPVVGAADILLFPNLTAANLTVKAIMYTADCHFGGILAGAQRLVAFMSRADTVATRLRSLALALRLSACGWPLVRDVTPPTEEHQAQK
jgi:phosphate butyryltransferase